MEANKVCACLKIIPFPEGSMGLESLPTFAIDLPQL